MSRRMIDDSCLRARAGAMALVVLCTVVMLTAPAAAQIANGGATTIQLPTFGVAIDAEGVLSRKTYYDPGGRLRDKRIAAARSELAGDLLAPSKMRKISLVRLKRAIRLRLDEGKGPSKAMRRLAGLQRMQYLFFYPEERDIVIAGPAEGWIEDPSGRAVGASSGRPVLLLEDLIVALRAYPPGGRDKPFIGCTIDPDPEGLTRLVEFQRSVPRSVSQGQRNLAATRIAQGLRDALGMANIRVFGVSDKTHFAQVLIEADYRMKLIGVGLEPPPVKMTTFASALSGARHSTLQRWWFTPNYDCVKVTEDRLAMELVGQGVRLLGEDKLIGPDGALVSVGAKPSKASRLFTTAFTRKYDQISAASPVYAQMRNMIDLLVAAAFLRGEDYYARAGWNLGVFADESALPVQTMPNPRQVECAVHTFWKGNRLFSPAGGGVSIQADEALREERLLGDSDGKLRARRELVGASLPPTSWWWD